MSILYKRQRRSKGTAERRRIITRVVEECSRRDDGFHYASQSAVRSQPVPSVTKSRYNEGSNRAPPDSARVSAITPAHGAFAKIESRSTARPFREGAVEGGAFSCISLPEHTRQPPSAALPKPLARTSCTSSGGVAMPALITLDLRSREFTDRRALSRRAADA